MIGEPDMIKGLRTASLLCVFFFASVLAPVRAHADILSGTLSLGYDDFKSTTTDAAGNSLKVKGSDFTQSYNLNLNMMPFPNVGVLGGVLVEKDATRSSSAGTLNETSDTTVRPFIDVNFRDPLNIYLLGAGYSIVEATQRESNSPAVTFDNEVYRAVLRWTPLSFPTFNLPTLDLQATRTNTFDQERVQENTTTDTVNLNTQIVMPIGLNASDQASSTDTTDKLNELETRSLVQGGRLTYSNDLWNRRVTFGTSYSIFDQNIEASGQGGGGGTVNLQLFPFTGLSAVVDIPTPDVLFNNGPLIDNNLTASANIDIGSSLRLLAPPDTRLREMGVDFSTPAEVNSVLIWVNERLPPAIADSFSWTVYTSTDNLNWVPAPGIAQATFGAFQNSFTINFDKITTRYLKVATTPLELTVPGATGPDFQNIFVTEMQVFLNQSVQTARNETSSRTQYFTFNVNALLVPGLSYVFSYNLSEQRTSVNGIETSTQQYTLSNGLAFNRVFRPYPWVTASGRFSRDDFINSNGQRTGGYTYSALVTATPLTTLRGSLVYSGQTLDDGASSDNVSLNATAQFYSGVSANTSFGAGTSRSNIGQKTNTVNSLSSVSITPRRDVSLSFSYGTTRTDTLGAVPSVITRSNAGMTYRPLEAVYLTASISSVSRTGYAATQVQNYGLNWSPFLNGDLQFNFTYNESLEADTNTRTKTVGPTLSWRVASGASIDVSYLQLKITSPQVTQNNDILSTSFRMKFL
jgi:hypothetical protein